MNQLGLPHAAFFDPYGRNRKEVEEFISTVESLVMDFGASAASRSPLPGYDYEGHGELSRTNRRAAHYY